MKDANIKVMVDVAGFNVNIMTMREAMYKYQLNIFQLSKLRHSGVLELSDGIVKLTYLDRT